MSSQLAGSTPGITAGRGRRFSVLGVFSIGGGALAQVSKESGPFYEIGDFSVLRKSAPSFFGKEDLPRILNSNRPAAEPTTSAGTPKLFVSSAARLTARDLCLQVEQYVILNLSSISLTPYVNEGLEWPSLSVEQPQCNPCRLAVLVPEGKQIVTANVRHRRKEYKETGSVLNLFAGPMWVAGTFYALQVETMALRLQKKLAQPCLTT